jgi:PAS domain S-box-containing protein
LHSSAQISNVSSLHDSLKYLYGSEHLGVVTANVHRVLDANDAFLHMIKFSREELQEGRIDWRAMTPPDSLKIDEIALEQLRQYGASVPFEKEYVLRDGTRLPMLMGAVRLSEEPLEWMCYVVDLTDGKRAERAQQETRELHAKHDVVNQIAHELNNPLAALTFIVGALQLRPSVQQDEQARAMLADAEHMMSRISALTRAVLVASDGDQ